MMPMVERLRKLTNTRSPANGTSVLAWLHSSRDTPALLGVLARHGALATFFWLGERVQYLPELAQAAAAAGHQIAIHGYRHQAFPLVSANALRMGLDRTR